MSRELGATVGFAAPAPRRDLHRQRRSEATHRHDDAISAASRVALSLRVSQMGLSERRWRFLSVCPCLTHK